jgi:small multidrug resistance pump
MGWARLGTALIAVIGIFGFKGHVNALKMVSLLVIVAGVIGLNLSDRMT